MASVKTLNVTNASPQTLKVRLTHTYFRQPTNAKLTAFGGYFVSESGDYIVGEALFFGTPDKQKTELKNFQDKYTPGSAWQFRRMQAKAKDSKYHSAPHPVTINLTHKNMTAKSLSATEAQNLPSEAEPRMTAGDVLGLSRDQLLDVHGRVAEIKRDLKQKDSYISELHICDDQGIHLTASSTTVVAKAGGSLPGAARLNALDIASMATSTLSAAGNATDYKTGRAMWCNLSVLEYMSGFQKELPEQLSEAPSCTVALLDTDPDHLCAKGTDRIYAKASMHDSTGSVQAYLTESSALALAESDSKASFLDAVSTDAVNFPRARLRLRYATSKDGKEAGAPPSFAVVCAEPRTFDTATPTTFIPSEDRLLPAKLTWLSMSPTGRLAINPAGNGAPTLTSGALVLLRGVRDPTVTSIDDGFAIVNAVRDAMEESKDDTWSAPTTAIVSKLPRYSIPRKHVALAHITHINVDAKELLLSEVWAVPEAASFPQWQKELNFAQAGLNEPPATMKRKRDPISFQHACDEIFTNTKKRYAPSFGSAEEVEA
ncbi:unnamed protein product [Prorocentrum cordatum]|uniref:Uncharacterized protein n=1 Tax=Prorocentrum cordatum TaxID=2364126 RepID=A0ABN9QB20_9DINO|nr:unnamed protein product [Polarella glacialis]